ncbi:hypothetical protein [Massilia sp. YIM B04103]|uniref:hypothetical protein n=1 Tax=Massilia sp. YIM B04103 TaxID=2963106 RepID=UPI00210C2725|nr:hypothetical protein [Massilia sp. YIM B04103]
MAKKWKTRENTRVKRDDPHMNVLKWLSDKENRATLFSLGSGVGIAFILGYYGTIDGGFTPKASFAEGSIVFVKAAFWGTLFLASFYFGVYSCAWAYRLSGTDIENLKGSTGSQATSSLAARSIAVQAITAATTVGTILYFELPADISRWYCAPYALIALSALLYLIRAPRLDKFGFAESRSQYSLSLFYLAWMCLFSLLIFALITGGDSRVAAPRLDTAIAWGGLAVVASILATMRRTKLLSASFLALCLMLMCFSYLQVPPWPLRAVAYMAGIAEPYPVTLSLPATACQQLKAGLKGTRDIECQSEAYTTIEHVLLDNGWGERWLLRLDKESKGIQFDGAGVGIYREERPSSKQSAGSSVPPQMTEAPAPSKQ